MSARRQNSRAALTGAAIGMIILSVLAAASAIGHAISVHSSADDLPVYQGQPYKPTEAPAVDETADETPAAAEPAQRPQDVSGVPDSPTATSSPAAATTEAAPTDSATASNAVAVTRGVGSTVATPPAAAPAAPPASSAPEPAPVPGQRTRVFTPEEIAAAEAKKAAEQQAHQDAQAERDALTAKVLADEQAAQESAAPTE